MSLSERLVTAGRVGRAHGRDGSFWLEDPLDGGAPLGPGAEVVVAGSTTRVAGRAGADARPLLRLDGVGDRAAAAALRGQPVLVAESRAPLGPGEWLAEDLVGLSVVGLGEVRRVLAGPSCDLLEVGEESVLVPLVSDAISLVDVPARRVEVDLEFLGLEGGAARTEAATPPAPR